jgi:N-acetyl-anhydromuramyl-L-alanine amidase AmpD
MSNIELRENDYELGEHDERDLADQRRSPPSAHAPSFRSPDDDPALSGPAAVQKFAVVNRGLPEEGVANCRIVVGTVSGVTNAFGNATLDLSMLDDAQHELMVAAPDNSEAVVGPGFPPDIDKERMWRPFRGRVVIQNGGIISGEPSEWIDVTSGRVRIQLRPVWLRAPSFSNRSAQPDMIVIHHTAGVLEGDLREFLFGGAVSIHYLVAPNGEVYKLVDESKTAFHAGISFWQGSDGLNSCSIGIEMTHKTGVEYPSVQVDAVVDLVRQLHQAFPMITAGRIIGHSDVGICDPGSPRPCTPPSPKRLGRKSTDPGSAFPWERIEALGLGLRIVEGSVRPDIYGGFFRVVPIGKLRIGDNDNEQRYNGQIHRNVNGAVRELQEDLSHIGYFCPPDGVFGQVTARAVQMFQQHMFSGSRRTGRPDMLNSGDGNVDLKTADVVKRVLGEVEAKSVG